jgi:proline iminopeptidase
LRPITIACILPTLVACAWPRSAPDSPFPGAGFFIGADDTHLFYRAVGNGPDTVVVVHGFQGNNQNYLAPDLQPLARGRTLLFYDQRGGGRSESVRDPEHLGLDDQVHDLEALRRHFGLERLSLLGHSGGTLIALRYALMHPASVERLLLVSAPPLVEGYGEETVRAFQMRLDSATWAEVNALHASLPTAQDPVAVCRQITRVTLPKAFLADPTAVERMRGDFCAASEEALQTEPERLAAFQKSLSGLQWGRSLSELMVPVLFIHGDHDAIPVESARASAALLPDARILVIHGADHLPWLDQPAQFFVAADRFFEGTWPDRAEVIPEPGSEELPR